LKWSIICAIGADIREYVILGKKVILVVYNKSFKMTPIIEEISVERLARLFRNNM